MKRILLVTLSCLLLGFLLIGADCEILSFDSESMPLSVKITEEFHIQGNSADLYDNGTINMAEIFGDEGVNYDNIDSITVQNIEIKFKDNLGPAQITFVAAGANFIKSGSVTPYNIVALVGFNESFASISGVVYDPINTPGILGTNPAGIAELSSYISVPPPKTFNVQAAITGIAGASLPADFVVELAITIQIHYAP